MRSSGPAHRHSDRESQLWVHYPSPQRTSHFSTDWKTEELDHVVVHGLLTLVHSLPNGYSSKSYSSNIIIEHLMGRSLPHRSCLLIGPLGVYRLAGKFELKCIAPIYSSSSSYIVHGPPPPLACETPTHQSSFTQQGIIVFDSRFQ